MSTHFGITALYSSRLPTKVNHIQASNDNSQSRTPSDITWYKFLKALPFALSLLFSGDVVWIDDHTNEMQLMPRIHGWAGAEANQLTDCLWICHSEGSLQKQQVIVMFVQTSLF